MTEQTRRTDRTEPSRTSSDDLHGFVTGTLLFKLRSDVAELRVFSRGDLMAAACYHIRRLLLARPSWSCRTEVPTALGPADIVLYRDGVPRGVILLDLLLQSDGAGPFPGVELDHRMELLRQLLNALGRADHLRGWLVGVFDADDTWLFPSDTEPERQACFWLPINCRDFPSHEAWRTSWDRTARG